MRAMEEQLYRSTVQIFEELAFMLPDDELSDEQREASPVAAAVVRFHGPVNGVFGLQICGNLLPTIAANMLGLDEVPGDQDQTDSLCEIANVICGNVLPAVTDPKYVFDLEKPYVIESLESFPARDGKTVSVAIGMDDGRAEVILNMESE